MSKGVKKTRIIAIDILKFLAVFVVLNSHFDVLYGDYSWLSTGGAFGDALFFFCSGFMLFKGEMRTFGGFMKRRITRIFPTIIMVSVVAALMFGNKSMFGILITGGAWFVACIMIYYVVLWFIRRYMRNLMWLVWGLTAILILGWFYLVFDYTGETLMYGETYFKWAAFFLFMLQGAVMGVKVEQYEYSGWVIPKLLVCAVVWYAVMYFAGKNGIVRSLQYVSLVPLLGVTYYGYLFCCAPWWRKLYDHRFFGQVIYIIGGLCLECYLIQGFFITDKYNGLFPMNVILALLSILLVSYAVNFLSKGLVQTFNDEEYDWKKCILKK